MIRIIIIILVALSLFLWFRLSRPDKTETTPEPQETATQQQLSETSPSVPELLQFTGSFTLAGKPHLLQNGRIYSLGQRHNGNLIVAIDTQSEMLFYDTGEIKAYSLPVASTAFISLGDTLFAKAPVSIVPAPLQSPPIE